MFVPKRTAALLRNDSVSKRLASGDVRRRRRFDSFANGKILLGATHENDGGWDLTPTEAAKQQLLTGIGSFWQPRELFAAPMTVRVGTRAYTSDFAPFLDCFPVSQD